MDLGHLAHRSWVSCFYVLGDKGASREWVQALQARQSNDVSSPCCSHLERKSTHSLSYPWLWWTRVHTSALVVIIKYYPPVTWHTCCVYSQTLMSWYLSPVSKNISLSLSFFQIGVSGSSEELSLLKWQSPASVSVDGLHCFGFLFFLSFFFLKMAGTMTLKVCPFWNGHCLLRLCEQSHGCWVLEQVMRTQRYGVTMYVAVGTLWGDFFWQGFSANYQRIQKIFLGKKFPQIFKRSNLTWVHWKRN